MTHAHEGEPHQAPPQAPPEAPRQTTARPARVKRTRVSGTWVAVIIALVVLVFLLVFILQNLEDATITFLWGSGSMPLALAMLFSAIGGAALVALIGAARIFQLRKATKRLQRSPR